MCDEDLGCIAADIARPQHGNYECFHFCGEGDSFHTECGAKENEECWWHPNRINPTPRPTPSPTPRLTPRPTLAPTPRPTPPPTPQPTPAPILCKCAKPGSHTNKMKCPGAELEFRHCASGDVCYAAEPFEWGKWSKGCMRWSEYYH
mmetsp:Transcript_55572/g.107192  ORF Transcript_55572/g.107192 Transcript_55572/m.107192 type:complete len:147 (+) Transcript_55572:87-527(+)